MRVGRSSRIGRSSWGVLGLAVLAQMGISMVEQGLPVLTGFIKSDLGLSASTAGLVVSSFAFGKIFGAYAGGVWADRYGERRVLVGGGALTAGLVGLAVLLPSPAFVVALVAAGAAGAVGTPAGGRIVLLAFPRRQLGLALGIRQTAIPLAGLASAALLPWIAHSAGWRWSLATAALLALVALVPLAAVRIEQREVLEPSREHVPLRSVLDRRILLLVTWGCLLVTGQYAVITFLALDIDERTDLGLARASMFVAVANAFGIVGRIGWGAFSDRWRRGDRRAVLSLLTSFSFLAALLLATLPASAPLAVYGAASALAGLSVIGFQGLLVTMVAEAAGPRHVGAVTGLLVTVSTAALALSPPLYGLVADLAGSFRAVWAALAVVVAVSYLPARLLPAGPRRQPVRS